MVLSGKRIRPSLLQGSTCVKRRHCVLDVTSKAHTRSNILLGKRRVKGEYHHGRSYSSSDESKGFNQKITGNFGVGCCGIVGGGTPFIQSTGLSFKTLETAFKHFDFESVNINYPEDKDYSGFDYVTHERNYNLHNLKKNFNRNSLFTISGTRQRQISKSDLVARGRCFDYILQSIDEVWGRYCNTTSTAENEVHDRLGKSNIGCTTLGGGSPKFSFTTSFGSNNTGNGPSQRFSSDYDLSDSGYKSEITDPTEYETDCDYRKVSKLPQSIHLQSLKDRLVKAKYDLENSYDTTNLDDCIYFWRRWDMIKYSAVEMMEEDDDDELIESVIDELEQGRCYIDS